MARRPTTPVEPPRPAFLVKPRNSVRDELLAQIDAGKALRATPVNSEATLTEWADEVKSWSDFNVELLRRYFSETEYADAYTRDHGPVSMLMRELTTHEKRDRACTLLNRRIANIRSLAERLDLIDEAPSVAAAAPTTDATDLQAMALSRDVFLVHGHDDAMKEIVARFLERCDLRPIILHEQADMGRTLIEKFEQSSDVGFAVVLLSPDDVGGPMGDGTLEPTLTPRARQNVILELGYFAGKLGRSKVCALRRGDVEIPSDFSGVVYTSFGPDDAWKMKLAREIKASGISIDLNEALS